MRLFVSAGPSKVEVPNVVGLSRESAEQQLGNAGLEVAVNEEESDQRENEVLSQDPGGGSRVDKGHAGDHHGLHRPAQGRAGRRPHGVGCGRPAATRRSQPRDAERKVDNEDDDGKVVDQSPATARPTAATAWSSWSAGSSRSRPQEPPAETSPAP